MLWPTGRLAQTKSKCFYMRYNSYMISRLSHHSRCHIIKVKYLPESCLAMVSHQSAIIIIFAAVAFGLMFQAHKVLAIATEPGFPGNDLIRLSPVAVSGN